MVREGRRGTGGARACAAIALLLATGPAWGWNHVYPSPYAWHPDDLPVEQCVAPDAYCPDGLPEGYCRSVMEQAHAVWTGADDCLGLGEAVVTECEPTPCRSRHTAPGPDGLCSNLGFDLADPRSSVGYDDPHEELEVGVLSASLTLRAGNAFTLNGTTYRWVGNSDIVFNDGVRFVTSEEALDGDCDGATSMLPVAVHELGHLYGMGHSCDQYDACDDLRTHSVMFWEMGGCERPSALSSDDLAGFLALYGPRASVVCEGEEGGRILGAVPLEVSCVVEGVDDTTLVGASWTIAPLGETLPGASFTWIFHTPGAYDVAVDATTHQDRCEDGADDGVREVSRETLVIACGLPEVAFTASHVDALTYQVVNATPLEPEGCITDIVWHVFEGTDLEGDSVQELVSSDWEPAFELPHESVWSIVANVAGVAGTSAAVLVIDASPPSDEDDGMARRRCDTSGAGGLASAALVWLALGAVRRRRSTPR